MYEFTNTYLDLEELFRPELEVVVKVVCWVSLEIWNLLPRFVRNLSWTEFST